MDLQNIYIYDNKTVQDHCILPRNILTCRALSPFSEHNSNPGLLRARKAVEWSCLLISVTWCNLSRASV